MEKNDLNLFLREINCFSDREKDLKGMEILRKAFYNDENHYLYTEDDFATTNLDFFVQRVRSKYDKKELSEYRPRIFIIGDSSLTPGSTEIGFIIFNVHSFRNAQGTYCIYISPEWQKHNYASKSLLNFLEKIFKEEIWMKMMRIRIFPWNNASLNFHKKFFESKEFTDMFTATNFLDMKIAAIDGEYVNETIYFIERK